MAENLFYHYPLGFKKNIYGVINASGTCSQVVILGISVFEKPKQLSRTVDCHPTLPLPPGLQTSFFTFTMLWTCSVQNGVELIEISIFYKSEKASGQSFRQKI